MSSSDLEMDTVLDNTCLGKCLFSVPASGTCSPLVREARDHFCKLQRKLRLDNLRLCTHHLRATFFLSRNASRETVASKKME
jgi:hypothetical protein